MTTMNISLPEVIHRDQDRHQFKAHLLAGIHSGIEGPMDAAFFTALRQRVDFRKKLPLAGVSIAFDDTK